MRYLTFASPESTTFKVCFLVPVLNQTEIIRHYLAPHMAGDEAKVIAYDLYKTGKKTSVKLMREYLDELLPLLADLGVTHIVVCDADYYKTLTKAASTENDLGYVKDSVAGSFRVTYCPNFKAAFYNPEKVAADIRIALIALQNDLSGSYIEPGMDVIKFAAYPDTVESIKTWLQRLLDMDCDLTADIEAFSLKHYSAGIGTISFAWNQHEGIAFPVDFHPHSRLIRKMLREFFEAFQNKLRWHHIGYDVYVLIYQLWMDDLLDTAGLLKGMSHMLTNWDCTRLITYLATNSCAGNKLGLKIQAQEFAGNYAVDEIDDIQKIPLDKLLTYNLVDALSTWYVYNKHWPTVVADNQVEIYETLFKPAMLDIIQMQLTGMPLDMSQVQKVQTALQDVSDNAQQRFRSFQFVEEFVYEQTNDEWEKDYQKRKEKAKFPDKIQRKDRATFPDKILNPNSPDQLQRLLYDKRFLGLPVIDVTDTKLPATGGETLEKLIKHTNDPDVIAFLEALIEFKAVDKILTAFLPAFLEAPQGPDGHHYLFGYFNLGGTVSGRLSSSNPNLQNLPANVVVAISETIFKKHEKLLAPFMKKSRLKLGSLIKSCFKAPPGWLFVGLDFASLEDRISALTTKDPNKLKVYTDGYDGHSLRAYSYFGEHMPDIDPNSVESINSIQDKYPSFRQDSKAPTFALTYQGTYITLMTNCGFTEELAKQIESRYHEFYFVSDKWVADRLDQAGRDGYITAAFGLRVRTPLLKQVIQGNSRTPYEAAAEGRTAGNALGQSWCLLNSRAASEFMGKVRTSPHRLTIRPCAQIHDASYYMIRDNMPEVMFVNEHLVKAVEWQDHPDIAHPDVKLGGELSVFFPTWANEMTIPNGATEAQISEMAAKHFEQHCQAA